VDKVGVDWWAVRGESSVGARQFEGNLDFSAVFIDHLLAIKAGEDFLVTVGDYVDMNLHASQVVSSPREQRSFAVTIVSIIDVLVGVRVEVIVDVLVLPWGDAESDDEESAQYQSRRLHFLILIC